MRLSVAVRPTETSKSSSKLGVAPGWLRVMLAFGLFCWSPTGGPAAGQSGAAVIGVESLYSDTALIEIEGVAVVPGR